MSYNFGNNLKKLRRERGLTQEQLAELLGISSQAVSKWETSNSFPDISMLPILAGFFGVSVDSLLGFDVSRKREDIDTICTLADKILAEEKHIEAVSFLREAILKYPGNDRIMYKLAWALSGTLHESPENYDEAILLYHKILDVSTDTEIRAKATRDLMYRYYTKGNIAAARSFAELLPPFSVCREYHLGRSNLLEGAELAEYLKENIRLLGQAMLECLEYFEDEQILPPKEKLPYTTESAKEKREMLKAVLDES